MYKIATALLIIFILCPLIGQKATAETKIFVIDTSGSMRREGLFENIKRELKKLIAEEGIGNRVLILTFDEYVKEVVLDTELRTQEDIDTVNSEIDRLEATGPWTWMTRAFELTVKHANRLKKEYPQDRLTIYLLTDGRNDPPPRVQEPPLRFVEVLVNYFKDFKLHGAHIYLLSYRPLEDEEREKVTTTTPVKVVEPSVQAPIPRIELTFSDFDFGDVDLSREGKTVSGWITVDKLPDTAQVREIRLTPSTPQYTFEVAPEIIRCEREGQKEEISITLPAGLSSGKYTGSIRLDAPNTIIDPSELVFSFSVPVVDGDGRMWLFLVILLLLAVLFCLLYFGLLRRKTVWVGKGDDEPKEAELRGWHKTYLGDRGKDSDLSFGLPDYYLRLKRWRNAITLGEEKGENREINFYDSFPCKTPEGGNISFRFYETEPQKEGIPEEGEEKEKVFDWNK